MSQIYRKNSSEIVNHAIEMEKRIGGSQSDICEMLGIDTGFFSKCKHGKKPLPDDKLSQLVNKYGFPSFLRSGTYQKGIKCVGVTKFLKTFLTFHYSFIAKDQLEIWNWPKFQENMAYMFDITDEHFYVDSYGDNKVREIDINTPKHYSFIKKQLKKLLADEAFLQWFDMFETSNTCHSNEKVRYPHELHEILEAYKLKPKECLNEDAMTAFFQRLGTMQFVLEGIEHFDFEETQTSVSLVLNEYVIEGECIYKLGNMRLKDGFKTPSTRIQAINHNYPVLSFNVMNMENDIVRQYDRVDYFCRCHMRLYMTNELNYYMHVRLEQKNDVLEELTFIIQLDRNDVVSDIKLLIAFFEGEIKPMDEAVLKSELAERGAYLPGISVLT